ncbi:MAG: CBS domain-containing protein [Planctomycetota bacterium]|nr:MAG: CBS domain-containing protein [Planctomycetota bacterium]
MHGLRGRERRRRGGAGALAGASPPAQGHAQGRALGDGGAGWGPESAPLVLRTLHQGGWTMSHTPGDPYCVGAWMSRNPTAVGPEELARQAYFTMRREGFRHLPVVEEGRLVGMVTDRDLRRPDLSNDPDGWNDDYRLSDDYTVRDLMTEKVLTASPKDPLERAIKTMQDARVGALPVLDKTGALIGILTTRDLMNALGAALAAKGEVLRR